MQYNHPLLQLIQTYTSNNITFKLPSQTLHNPNYYPFQHTFTPTSQNISNILPHSIIPSLLYLYILLIQLLTFSTY